MHANETKWDFRETHPASINLKRGYKMTFLESRDPTGEGSMFVLLFDFHFVWSCDMFDI